MRRLGLALLASTGLLQAQQLSYGAQIQAIAPIKEFKEGFSDRPGGGAGIHFFLGLADGLALRPRADWTQFRVKGYEGFKLSGLSHSDVEARLSQSHLGVDVLWYLDGTTGEGFYLVARGGATRTSERLEGSLKATTAGGPQTVALPQSTQEQNHATFAVGFGFGVGRRLSLEFLYGSGKVDLRRLALNGTTPVFTTEQIKSPAISAGLVYTF